MSRFVLFFDGNSVNPIIRCSEYQKEEFLKDFKENEDEYKGIIKYILKNSLCLILLASSRIFCILLKIFLDAPKDLLNS